MRSGVALALEILFFAPLSIVTKQNLFIYMELDAQHCVESIAHTIGAAASALCVATVSYTHLTLPTTPYV